MSLTLPYLGPGAEVTLTLESPGGGFHFHFNNLLAVRVVRVKEPLFFYFRHIYPFWPHYEKHFFDSITLGFGGLNLHTLNEVKRPLVQNENIN